MSLAVKSFRQVLYGGAKRLGMVPENDGLQRSDAVMLTEFINSAVKLAWEFYTWPDAQDLREEEILDHPTIEGARYVPRSTSARTLKVTLKVWDRDPRANCNACPVTWNSQPDGLYFYSANLSTVWVQYRPEPPEYTDEEWSATRTYAAGDLTFDASGTGHVYRALQTVPAGTLFTSTAHWQQVPVLAILAEPIKAGVVGAWNAAEGQHGTARVKQEYMIELLDHEIVQIQNQGGQTIFYQ